MPTNAFANIQTVVRTPRLAVFINEQDSDWQETCRQIMRVLPWLWGGKHSLIIPTDGTAISDQFWQLLETFDPDFVCSFDWTLKDWEERLPDRYEQQFQTWLTRQNALLDDGETLPSDLRASSDHSAHLQHLRSVEIDPTLQMELRARLAPFYFEDHVVKGLAESKSDSSYPHTSIHTILPHCEHPSRIYVPDVTAKSIPLPKAATLSAGKTSMSER